MTFYNTTHETGTALAEREQDANSQEARILMLFRSLECASPSQIWVKYPQWPITSIRRAITNLASEGKLHKTQQKVTGAYGKHEYIWQVKRFEESLF